MSSTKPTDDQVDLSTQEVEEKGSTENKNEEAVPRKLLTVWHIPS